MGRILDFLDDFPWVWGFVLVAVVVLVCVCAYHEEKSWDSYAQAHHCKKVGTKDGGVGVGIGSDGNAVTVINPDQTIYKCDNDEMVIR
jgi:hypothetical protein